MEKKQGIKITFEVKGIENYAKCVLTYVNIKSSRDAVADVRTIEGSDLIVVIGYKEFETALISVAEDHAGKVIDTEDKIIFEIEDDDVEVVPEIAKEMDKLFNLNEIEKMYLVGKFENR